MRAVAIVGQQIQQRLGFVHAKRLKAVFRAVSGLVQGGRLWLTGLGRDFPGSSTSEKHRIKAADRLLGNVGMHAQLPALYSAFAQWLLERIPHPILFVDGCEISQKVCELRAAIWFRGRALTVYSEAHPAGMDQNPTVHREFLRHLATVLPPHCKPILVTDAGFHHKWFDEIVRLGWHFVGRIRNRTQVLVDGRWQPNKALHRWASDRPQDLGQLLFNKTHQRLFRFVLAKKRKSKHRSVRTVRGTISQKTTTKRYAAAAREPWLLATNLDTEPARLVVEIYSGRMQIEESFRDSKSHRLGWSLSNTRSRPERVAVLLFLGAVATAIVHVAGLAAEKLGLDRKFQANTTRKRRVLSVFFLGCRVLQTEFELPEASIRWALRQLTRIAAGPLAPA